MIRAKGQHVKATVTLKQASKLDNGTNVVIYSESRNAVVGPLIGNGPASTTTVGIPKGQTSATLDITTNDNGLKVGDSKNVNVTAFYAQPTQGQLHVRAAG